MDRLQKAVARATEKNRMKVGARVSDANVAKVDQSEIRARKKVSADLISRRIVAGQPSVPASKIFNVLRTRVLSQMRENNWKTIAVSSPSVGQGKSTIAANLAVAVAMEVNQSALVVDLDLERPNLHRAFGFETDAGLADVLRGDMEVSDVMTNIGVDRLSIIPGSGSMVNSSEWLSDPATLKLFAELRVHCRSGYIIYDMPAVLQSDHLLKIASSFDCTLLVLEDGACTQDEVSQSVQVMKQTNFLGYVLNKAADLPAVMGGK